jgi:hypothetical protein
MATYKSEKQRKYYATSGKKQANRNSTLSTKFEKLQVAPGSSPVYRDRYDEIDWKN